MSCLLRVDGLDWRLDGEIADVHSGIRLPSFQQSSLNPVRTHFNSRPRDNIIRHLYNPMASPREKFHYARVTVPKDLLLDFLAYERRQSSPPALQPGITELASPSC